jgi:Hypothetical protein (DUF2513)
MKRDMDLIRKILIKIEDLPTYDKQVEIEVKDYAPENIQYHLKLLHDAKFIEVLNDGTSELWVKVNITPTSLSWEGHEFLDAIRNETVWNKTKEIVKEKGVGLAFGIIKDLAIQIARQMVGLP